MQKGVRRSIVFLLVFALFFANLTSAGTALASETGTAQEDQSGESIDKQKAVTNENEKGGNGGSEELADSEDQEEAEDSAEEDEAKSEESDDGEGDAGSQDTNKEEAAGEAGSQGAEQEDANADDAQKDEADLEESAEGADGSGMTPAEDAAKDDAAGQKEDAAKEDAAKDDKDLKDQADKDSAAKAGDKDKLKKGAVRANADQNIEYKKIAFVVSTIGKTEKPLDVEYRVKLWTEEGDDIVPFANQTLPTGETTDSDGVFTKSMTLAAGASNVVASVSVPNYYYFEATLSPDSTDEVGLFFSGHTVPASEGISGYTSYYSSVVCLAYTKPAVHIVKEDVNEYNLSGAKLQITDTAGNVLDSWTSGDSEHTIRLLPNINNIAGDYYTLSETEAPLGYSKASPIEFRVVPEPTGVVIGNTAYNDYTIHMVNELKPGTLRVEMDFDTQNGVMDSDTNQYPFNVTIQIDGLKTNKSFTYQYTYGQYSGERTVWLGPDNKSFVQQLHSYDHLILSGLPVGVTYSVSQQTAGDKRYLDPVYDEYKTGTIESDKEAKTVITNTARLYTWSLTKQVPGAYNGQEFKFTFYFVDDFFQWGSAEHYYYINDEKHLLRDLGHEHGAGGTIDRTRLGDVVYIKAGDKITVPNVAAAAHYYYAEGDRPPGYEGYTSSNGGMISDYDVVAINVSKMVSIRKLDQYGNHVSGAQMQILGHDHATVMQEFTTTDEDYFWIPKNYNNDGSDQYYLHEVSAPGGYLICEEDIPFTFKEGERVEYIRTQTDTWTDKSYYTPYIVTVNGEQVEGNILVMTDTATDVTISKTDITGEEEIGGASLAVYKAEDVTDGVPNSGADAIDSWTSEEGKSHQIVGKLESGGEYVLIETTAPDGYEKATAVSFTVNSDGTASTVTMVDEYSSHKVKISKTDVGGEEIEGAVITITGRAEGETEDIDEIKYTTDGTEPHEVELKPGTYTMTEVTAPEGYEKAESIPFTVKVDGTVLVDGKEVTDSTVTMVDEYVTYNVKISKTDVGGEEIEGAEITITGRADGESEDIEEIKYTTDGKAPHEVELKPGTYTMTEVTAPDGYEKAESITFTVKVDGTVLVDGKEVTDSTVTMVDEYTTHNVKISKTDVGGEEIEGAEITITGRADGESEDIEEIKYTTDGKAPHEVELKPGTYTITEVTAPDGYEKAESITFTVKVDGTVLVDGKEVTDSTVTMVDEYVTYNVKISKTDVGGEEIEGAEITITGRADGESEDIEEIKYTTDGKAPHEIELRPGTYTMTEVTAPDGYEKAESITFTVEADGTVLVDGKEVTDSTVTMVDEYSTHIVKISKTDVGGKEIAGAVITITGRENGATKDIEEIKYTTDGKAPHEVELKPGTYTMTEVTAPKGYEKAESITFTVEVDGTVLVDGKDVKGTVTMVDKAKTTKKTSTTTKSKKSKGGRTGDESGVAMYIAIFAVAAAGLLAILVRRRRRS